MSINRHLPYSTGRTPGGDETVSRIRFEYIFRGGWFGYCGRDTVVFLG